MSDHAYDREAIECLEQLRAALAEHGITLPSLELHLLSYAGNYTTPPLITLGNCNTATADRLADALRKR
ncbi:MULTISPECIES: hypothetical protein [unclassified Streptomyces]|uniref:hypothetical protein n=1 Tax=unclassified Streptomyces TaxID=2593676 RepID=UPI001BEA14C4|nr:MULTISPECIES: hypothetical protein [unclassified Streptomyces]MBT2404027.1 hypothetical protein [Streptomyces sp. ISL-21]MBT2455738.1 hypothetical protein [Streptomyces sp. ISL-86]MBT2607928.1 hypothetical protein [Streptomyces sp. ISL-87]